MNATLAGVAQLVRVLSCNQRVVGSIPSQGTKLGRWLNPRSMCGRVGAPVWTWLVPSLGIDHWLGCIRETTNRCFSLTSMFLSLLASLPFSLSQNNEKKNILR